MRLPGQITVTALIALLSGCGNSTPATPDGGQAGAGGTTGEVGTGGSGGAVGTGGKVGTGGSGGAVGTGGTPGSGGAVSSGGATGTGGGPGSGGSDGGTGCGDNCKVFFPPGQVHKTFPCCNNTCVDLQRDPLNCGACGNRCPPDKPVCFLAAGGASCTAPTCNKTCQAGATCCGNNCCGAGELCCNIPGPIDFIGCWKPTAAEPSCPKATELVGSDRNIKRAVVPVNPAEVLARVTQMGSAVQDFRHAFGFGDGDGWNYVADGYGVALASIQALARLAHEQERLGVRLQRNNQVLERRIQALEKGPAPAKR